jgi:hypothetical protein
MGTGGPMGRIHLRRALEFDNPPTLMESVDVSDMLQSGLHDAFAAEAK